MNKKVNLSLVLQILLFTILFAVYYRYFPKTGDSKNILFQNIMLFFNLVFMIYIFNIIKSYKSQFQQLSKFQENKEARALDPLLVRLQTRNIATNSNWTGKIIDFVNMGSSINNVAILADEPNNYKVILNSHYSAKTLRGSDSNVIKLPGKFLGENWEGRISIQKYNDTFQTNEKVNFTLEYTDKMGQKKSKQYCYSEQLANFTEIETALNTTLTWGKA